MAVHHTLKPPARAGFGLLCAKFGTSELGFLVCGDGTGGFHARRRVLLDAPGPHLTSHGHLMRTWVPPIAWCTIACRLQAPKLVTGRAGSSPSPWHGKVDVSARAAVHMLGRVCLCAPGPWGHCKAICRCVGSSTDVHHTLDHSLAPDFGPFSAKFATCERGFWGCGNGTGRVGA